MDPRSRSLLLPVSLLLATVWTAYLAAGSVRWQTDHWSAWLSACTFATAVLACVVLLGQTWWRSPAIQVPSIQRAALASAVAALVVMPLMWALSVVLVRPNVAAPAADLAALWQPATDAADRSARARRADRRRDRLIGFLHAHRGKERFILAVPNALQAAPIIVATGEPVMATGGYLGRDPILTPTDLQKLAERSEIRFVMLGGVSLVRTDDRQRAIAA